MCRFFKQAPKGAGGQHFGGRIVFDRAGYVYLTLGDRGEMQRAQKPDDHAGSVIRLHDDGRVPKDNPFVGRPAGSRRSSSATATCRAPLHPQTGVLWTQHTARRAATRST